MFTTFFFLLFFFLSFSLSPFLFLFTFKPRLECVSEMERARRKKIKNGAGICCCKMCVSLCHLYEFLSYLYIFSQILPLFTHFNVFDAKIKHFILKICCLQAKKIYEKFHEACGAWKNIFFERIKIILLMWFYMTGSWLCHWYEFFIYQFN